MSYDELLLGLGNIDAFHKNTLLLFEDFVALVREKTYKDLLKNLTGPENGYFIWNSSLSEHMRLWVFSHDDRFRFAVMLVATRDEYLQEGQQRYKSMCNQLSRDPKFPLLLLCGVFEPRDKDRFNNDHNVRRNWVLNTTLIRTRDDQEHPDISELRFGDVLTLKSKEGTDSWWCEGAKYIINDLTSIKDATKLSEIASQFLAL